MRKIGANEFVRDTETARKNEKQTNFGSLLNNNGVKIYKNWHPSKSAQNKNRTLTCMQTKPFGIFINDYNLPRTTRKSVKINSTSASLLCNLCFFPSQNRTKRSWNSSFCWILPATFLRIAFLENWKNISQNWSRPRLAFCQKPIRADLPVGRSYRIAECSWRD